MRDLPAVLSAPFPHLVIDDLWDRLLGDVAREVPLPDAPGWRRYGGEHERKLEGPPPLWGPATVEMFETISTLAPVLGEAFGLSDLSMETIGGGYHLIPPGGFLDVHTDFSRSPQTGLYRRLNFMTYLNPDWSDEGGHLELWDADGLVVSIAPELGRTVVFETSATSWHGHPKPASRWRASVAAYFFSPHEPEGFTEQSTVWRAH